MNKKIMIILTIFLTMSALYFVSSAKDAMEKQALLKETEIQIGESYNELNDLLIACEEYIKYIDVIEKYSIEYDTRPEVIIAVMKLESNFDVNASSGTSYGVMQINDVHLKEFENKMDILGFDKNVQYGTSILGQLKTQNEDLHYILNSYNMGQYGYKEYVAETGKVTRAYSRQAIKIINDLKE